MNFEDLKNPELQEKLKNAQTSEDLIALAREEGVELTEEQLEAVSGGGKWLGKCWSYCKDHHCSQWDVDI